jgi:replicative DNA helicase
MVPCRGIPLDYLPNGVLAGVDDKDMAIAMFDPLMWARKFLDWHCLDPNNEEWKRKTLEGTMPTGFATWEPHTDAISVFHRPYQAEMLQCSSKYKVYRIGRQAGKTEVMCIAILHAIFTHRNFRCVVVCPYDAQVELIFDRLRTFIDGNVSLSNSVKRRVKKPTHTIELHNGSMVVGFTAGTKSKQEAGASRGQPANMLVFDEADYLSAGDLDAALMTIANFPEATVWMSSTPTGKRERFFETCRSKLYREFHFPSHVNPNWDEAKDQFAKDQLTIDGYKHEVLAEFGEQEEGVYQSHYVEAAQAEYSYGDYKPNSQWTYMMGVDWNDVKIGTTIAVIGYNPIENLLRVVEKVVMARSERTQLSACMRIAELNRVWNPVAIYVDRGFGTTQVEILHKYGWDALKKEGPNSPNARLRNIVKPYDFGSSVEIHDLFTRQPIQKKAKPFLVENSVRRFEQGMFKYPKKDEMFTKALLGYIVKRVSATGVPIYEEQSEQAGDHWLDAVNLGLVAFTLEETDFGHPKHYANIAFSRELGDLLSGHQSTGDNRLTKEAENRKPEGQRAGTMDDQPMFKEPGSGLPAANNRGNTTLRHPWNWPGYGHDAPMPKPRTLSEAFGQAMRKTSPRRGRRGTIRPSRKNV